MRIGNKRRKRGYHSLKRRIDSTNDELERLDLAEYGEKIAKTKAWELAKEWWELAALGEETKRDRKKLKEFKRCFQIRFEDVCQFVIAALVDWRLKDVRDFLDALERVKVQQESGPADRLEYDLELVRGLFPKHWKITVAEYRECLKRIDPGLVVTDHTLRRAIKRKGMPLSKSGRPRKPSQTLGGD